VQQLQGIKGIGKKSAERLIVELRDKLGKQSIESPISGGIIMNTPDTDAVQALIALGIGRPQAEQAIKKTMSIIPADASLELIIKQALKNL